MDNSNIDIVNIDIVNIDIVNIDIPLDILDNYIWPNISNKIKMLLNKNYYLMYHNKYYKISIKYIIFIIKNNIHISLPCIFNNPDFNNNCKKKIYYDNKYFYNYYSIYLYICRKYNNSKFSDFYINSLKINRQLKIKEYKKYVDKNILWIK